jgi:surface carbohydrate biosynthesis protein (TIGR04326 family)
MNSECPGMTLPQKVIFVSKNKMLQGRLDGLCQGDRCYYLCDDYAAFSAFKKKYAAHLDIHLLGHEFHDVNKEIAGRFLSFSHRINQRNASYAFWGTHLASRSSGTIPLLKHIVYFCCAKKILENADSRIVFICDSPALSKLIQTYVHARGMSCQIHRAAMDHLNPILIFIHLAIKAVFFLITSILRYFFSRLLRNRRIAKSSARERYFLLSWVTAGSLNKEGQYQDRNFGVLPNFLSEQGIDVWTIPLYFNLGQNIFAQMKRMSQSGYSFIFPEQYLSLLDILKSLRDGIKSLFLNLKGCDFDAHDVSGLVREIHRSTSLQPFLLSCMGIQYLLKYFSEQNTRIDRFIYPMENNPPEKPLLLAVRKYYPRSDILGFQHTVWLKEQLGVFLLPEELSYHPLPDRIICSGRKYPDILKITGFPPGRLVPGPNLRYTAVNKNLKTKQQSKTSGSRKILIILNYETNHSLELLEKTGAALRQLDQIEVYIKPHPTTPTRRIMEFLRNADFPAFAWADGSVQEWVLKSDAVVMTGGSVSNLETMATGVPLIRVSLENNFDFDCLWDEYPFAPFASSVEDIRFYLEKALQLNPEERERLIMFGNEIVRNYFEPVTPENLSVFL